jgi:hypothetical protein
MNAAADQPQPEDEQQPDDGSSMMRAQDPYHRLVWTVVHDIEDAHLLRDIRDYADTTIARLAEKADVYAALLAAARGDGAGAELVVDWLQPLSFSGVMGGITHNLGLQLYGSNEAWVEELARAAATGHLEPPV